LAVTDPKVRVSCLTVSRSPRLQSLKRAIDDFTRQTYQYRELLIVVDDDAYADEVEGLARSCAEPVYVLRTSQPQPLGTLRNLSLAHAHGSFLCQWDDDDRYGPDRIALQLGALSDATVSACFLHQQLHFFECTRQLFWTDWRFLDGQPVGAPLSQIIPGTVMFRRTAVRYPEEGSQSIRGEDTVLAAQLIRAGALGVEASPATYLRNYHGENTWDLAHHRAIGLRRSAPLEAVLAAHAEIEAALRYFEVDPPVAVMAGEQLAFTI
jgi:glycosyltransferase involved in cell wall biosynthesis